MKRIILLACISTNVRRGGMEESNYFKPALVQFGIVLCEVAQSKVAHRAGGIPIEHQQEWLSGKQLQRDCFALYRFRRKRDCLIARFESHMPASMFIICL